MEPGPQDRQRFLGMRLDDFANLADRGFPYLALDTGDVDHVLPRRRKLLRRCARLYVGRLRRGGRRGQLGGGRHALRSLCDRITDRGEHALDQRTGNEETDQERGEGEDAYLDDLEPIRTVQTEERGRCGGGARHVDLRERHAGDLDKVAARTVEPDGGFHQRLDLLHLGRRAGTIVTFLGAV